MSSDEELDIDGRFQEGDCGESEDKLPPWLDEGKFRRAQLLFKEYSFSLLLSHLSGLVMLVCVDSISGPLAFTSKSSSVPLLFRRYLQTLQHVRLWYTSDILDPLSAARTSLRNVRKVHKATASRIRDSGRLSTDCDPGVSMSQYDMALTQLAFVGLAVLHPRRMGLHGCTREDLQCLLHFWRYIGFLLGMQDRYNVAEGSFDDVLLRFRSMMDGVIKRRVAKASAESLRMSRGIVSAFSPHLACLRWESLLAHATSGELPGRLGLWERLCLLIMRFVMGSAARLRTLRVILNYVLDRRIDHMLLLMETRGAERPTPHFL